MCNIFYIQSSNCQTDHTRYGKKMVVVYLSDDRIVLKDFKMKYFSWLAIAFGFSYYGDICVSFLFVLNSAVLLIDRQVLTIFDTDKY